MICIYGVVGLFKSKVHRARAIEVTKLNTVEKVSEEGDRPVSVSNEKLVNSTRVMRGPRNLA